jgi:hypothetical protein
MACFKAIFRHSPGKFHDNRQANQPGKLTGLLRTLTTHLVNKVQCFCKVAVHIGYGTKIWLSVSKLPLKCAVVSLHKVVEQQLKCNTGQVSNCLIQFLLYRRSWTSLPIPFISVQRL